MPVGSTSAEDLASSDEIKIFKFEGEDEKRSSADLTDLKSSLITESDQDKNSFNRKSSSSAATNSPVNGSTNASSSNGGVGGSSSNKRSSKTSSSSSSAAINIATTSTSSPSSLLSSSSIAANSLTNGVIGGLSSSPINHTTDFSGKFDTPLHQYASPFGYSAFANAHSPYHHTHHPHHHTHNGTSTLGQMANKMASMAAAASHHHSATGSPLSPFASMIPTTHPHHQMDHQSSARHLPQPPPAHMGIPPVHIETKAVSISAWMDFDLSNIARNHPLYNLSGHGQYSHSVISDLAQQLPWSNPAMYQLQSAAFRSPYPLSSVSSAAFPNFAVRTPTIMPPHPASFSGHHSHPTFPPHPSFLPATSTNIKQEINDDSITIPTTTTSTSNGSTTKSNRNNNSSIKNGFPLFNGINGSSSSISPPSNSNRSSSSISNENVNRQNRHIDSENNHNYNNNNKINSINNQCNANGPNKTKLVNNHHKQNYHTPTTTTTSSTINGQSSSASLQQHLLYQQEQDEREQQEREQKMHIKKPLNAFMIYMKEMRPKVIAESTLKESAAINQILGKKWHDLSREEQEKYYDKARKERQLHMEMHPGWSAKDNYAINGKRKKKKRERNVDGERGALKKCRARYGLDQQNHWCKPCRRKKKCIRYLEAAKAAAAAAAAITNGNTAPSDTTESDNFGSISSVEVPTPESKTTNESLPSPLFYPSSAHTHHMYPNSVASISSSSPLGSRLSSLLTPNSPSTTSSFSSSGIASNNLSSASSTASSTSSFSSFVTSSSSSSGSSNVPPRNSPFSIEQLARPYCPQSRSSISSHNSNINNNHINGLSTKVQNNNNNNNNNDNSVTMAVITQLPTPPSSTDSASGTPAMLWVA